MYEEQNFDHDTIGKTHKTKKIVKTVVIVSVLVIFVVVAALFFKLYNGERKINPDVSLDSPDKSQDVSVSMDFSHELSEDASVEASFESDDISEEQTSETSEESSIEPEHGWVINSMGYTYLYQGKGYNQFNGTKALAEKYAEALNNLVSNLTFPVYSMIAPTSVEFADIPYDVKKTDDFYNSSQKTFISNVNSTSEAIEIDIYSVIASLVDEEYLYLRTDKNWTADAAYLAYLEFCTAVGVSPKNKEEYEMGSYVGYLGSFYNSTGSKKLKENADIVNYYRINDVYPCSVTMYNGNLVYNDRALIYSQLSSPISYGYYAFLGDRGETFTITSQNSETEKSLLVIGDSSAFAFVPYLVANYRNIYFINTEAYGGTLDKYLEDKNIDEALVLSYASTAASASCINKLNSICPIDQNQSE